MREKDSWNEIRLKWLVGILGGGFKCVLFSTLPGEIIQFDEHIFQMGRNYQLGIVLISIIYMEPNSSSRDLGNGPISDLFRVS